MNKIIIVLLSLVAATVIGQSCSDNTLSDQFDFTLLNSPTTVSGLNYCKSLKSGDSCCSAEIVNTFQNRTDELLERLTEAVVTRDKYLIQVREELYNNRTNIESFIQAFEAAWAIYSEDYENGDLNWDVDDLLWISHILNETSYSFYKDTEAFMANFTEFQKSRSTCYVEMVRSQAASWCLACDPNVEDYLDEWNDLQFGSEFQTRMVEACYDYLDLSVSQSRIIFSKFLLPGIENLTLWLENAAQGNEISNQETNDFLYDVFYSGLSEESENPAKFPALEFVCDSPEECDFILDDIFYQGLLDENLLIVGSWYGMRRILRMKENSGSKRLKVSKILRSRKLQGGSDGWNPDSDEAGIQAEFLVDPAFVNLQCSLDSYDTGSGCASKI